MTRVLIIGGGIGGLSLALFCQVRGMEVSVYERTDEPVVQGAGIMIAPNAMRAFQTTSVAQAIREASYRSEQMLITDERGERLMALEVPDRLDAIYAIHRKKLQTILLEAVGREHVHYGYSFESYEADEEGVSVRFANGVEERGDALVGADGIHSSVRQALHLDEPLEYAGYTCWRGVTERLSDDETAPFIEMWGQDGRFGIIPLGERSVYWYALVNGRAASQAHHEATPDEIAQRFESFAHDSASLIRRTKSVIHRDIFDFSTLKNWSRGRVSLLGDAVHAVTPNMGQGACQAIEDAYVLAEELARSTVPDAFATYTKRRYQRAHTIREQSRQTGALAHMSDARLIRVRNGVLRMLPRPLIRRLTTRLYTTDF